MLLGRFGFTEKGAARYVPTIGLVALFAVLAAMRSPFGILVYKSNEVLIVTVPIAGTIVALALPASQLAQSVMESFLSTADDLIKANKPLSGIIDYLSELAKRRQADLAAMKCVVFYSLASFIVGVFGVLGFGNQIQLTATLGVANLIACLSVGLLLASVLWFLPVVNSSFDFRKGNTLLQLLKRTPQVSAPAAPALGLAPKAIDKQNIGQDAASIPPKPHRGDDTPPAPR